MTHKQILNVLGGIWFVSLAGVFFPSVTAELPINLFVVQVACVSISSCLIAKKKAHSLVLAVPAAALFSYFYFIYIYYAEDRRKPMMGEDSLQ
jgi:hypothetical protein|tara:strand:+ start:205 stop:483 length:279 start_codon:yes stop_codon:yes gene_type:complete